jgi:retinol dehydrogenase-14
MAGRDCLVTEATSPDTEGITGRYFFDRKAVRSSRASYNSALGEQLWLTCAEMTGLITDLARHGPPGV